MARTTRPWREIRRGESDPDRKARITALERAMLDAMALADLREARAVTQVELAGRLGVNQGNVSRLERRNNLYLSTLQEYVAALGGDLQLVARFPDGVEIRLEPRARAAEPATA
jgi:DNA-binding Xre family transcriptional regulator